MATLVVLGYLLIIGAGLTLAYRVGYSHGLDDRDLRRAERARRALRRASSR